MADTDELSPEKIQKKLKAIGVEYGWMAPLYLPKRFVDYTNPIGDFTKLPMDENAIVYVTTTHKPKAKRGKLSVKAYDANGNSIFISSFGDTYALERRILSNRPFCVKGKVATWEGNLQLQSAELIADEDVNKVVAVYAGKAGAVATSAVAGMLSPNLTDQNFETSALFISRRLGLQDDQIPVIQDLLKAAHLPESVEIGNDAIRKLDILAAKDIVLQVSRQGVNLDSYEAHIPITHDTVDEAIREMPLPLTDEQKAAVHNIVNDLRSPFPAKHLLSGDVGTGKTAVYGTVVAAVRKSGGPVAIMAPNAPLASQIVKELQSWWPNMPVKLVTGEPEKKTEMVAAEFDANQINQAIDAGKTVFIINPNKKVLEQTLASALELLDEDLIVDASSLTRKSDMVAGKVYIALPPALKLADNEMLKEIIIDPNHRFSKNQRAALINSGVDAPEPDNTLDPDAAIYVGTTALLHRMPKTMKNGLLVVDEQQKFSTEQRERLLSRGANLLEATGTCIPRTMALVMFAGANVSRLSKCHVEKNIHTKVYLHNERPDALKKINELMANGDKCLIVYPLAEHGNDADKIQRSAEGAYQNLWSTRFPGKVRFVHGKMTDEEKNDAINAMKTGEAQMLISTTVVEVGIDIPGLKYVALVDAELQGLQGIHQIRGRVARKGGEGYCHLLPSENAKPEALDRLAILERCPSGFDLAVEDMKNRGLGDISINSVSQSGRTPSILVGRDIEINDIDMWVKNPHKQMEYIRLPADNVSTFTFEREAVAVTPKPKPVAPSAPVKTNNYSANPTSSRPMAPKPKPQPVLKSGNRF